MKLKHLWLMLLTGRSAPVEPQPPNIQTQASQPIEITAAPQIIPVARSGPAAPIAVETGVPYAACRLDYGSAVRLSGDGDPVVLTEADGSVRIWVHHEGDDLAQDLLCEDHNGVTTHHPFVLHPVDGAIPAGRRTPVGRFRPALERDVGTYSDAELTQAGYPKRPELNSPRYQVWKRSVTHDRIVLPPEASVYLPQVGRHNQINMSLSPQYVAPNGATYFGSDIWSGVTALQNPPATLFVNSFKPWLAVWGRWQVSISQNGWDINPNCNFCGIFGICFPIPNCALKTDEATWVGIDGVSTNSNVDLLQAGTRNQWTGVQTNYSHTDYFTYWAWYEYFPDYPWGILNVDPFDSVMFAVAVSGPTLDDIGDPAGNFMYTFYDNETTGATAEIITPNSAGQRAGSFGGVIYPIPPYQAMPFTGTSVEWIVERPQFAGPAPVVPTGPAPLTNYDSAGMSDMGYTDGVTNFLPENAPTLKLMYMCPGRDCSKPHKSECFALMGGFMGCGYLNH